MIQKHKDKFTDDELLNQYKVMPKLSALAHHFGVPDVTLWRRARKLGLEFKMGGKMEKFELSDILNGKHPQYPTIKLKKRLLKEKIFENKCAECGLEQWNGQDIQMHLDHIDGNCHNHSLENLRMLCPNCHSQTDTYCGKNK